MSDVTDLIERSKRYRNENFGHGSPVGNEIMAAMEAALERLTRPADDVVEGEGYESLAHMLIERATDGPPGGCFIPYNRAVNAVNAALASIKQTDAVDVNETPRRDTQAGLSSNGDRQTDAVKAERERCARIAENTKAYDDNLQKSAGCGTTGQRIAAAIRGAK